MRKENKILLLMVIALFLGYLPWYNFSAVLKFIAADFHLNASDTGLILSSFQLGYVVVVIITGWLADKIGPKKVIAWGTLLCGISSAMFVYLAKDFTSILMLRLCTGLSTGAIYAPGIALLSNWFAPSERGKAIGAYTAGCSIAYAGGYFVAAPLAAKYSWQTGILWTSLPVFIAAFIVFFFIQEKPAEKDLQFDGVLAPLRAPDGGYAGPLLITGAYMGHQWELYAFWGWIGPFMMACASASGYSDTVAAALGGRLAAFIILLGAPAVWLVGMAADKWGRTRVIIIAATCSLVPQFFIGYMYGMSLTAVVIAGLWIGFWVVADSAVYKAGLTDMISEKIRATFLGIQSAAGYSMTIITPLIFGKVLQHLNGKVEPTAATNWGLPFMVLGIGAIMAPVLAMILRKVPQAKLMAGGKM